MLRKSFEILGKLRSSGEDIDGTPLAAATEFAWGGVLVGLKMDLEGWVRDLKWSDYGSHAMCGLCGANRTTVPWTDVSDNALWRGTLLNYLTYRVKYAGSHPLHSFPGVTVHTSFLDVMHILDYKGITSWVAGAR
jgi:hypothetical protein